MQFYISKINNEALQFDNIMKITFCLYSILMPFLRFAEHIQLRKMFIMKTFPDLI